MVALEQHLRPRHRQLEAFAPHGLDQNAELQLAAAGDLHRILLGRLGDPQRDVAFRLAQQPLADHPALHLVALGAGERRIVDAEGHRQGRRIDRLRRQGERHLGRADRVRHRGLRQPGNRHDVARRGFLDAGPLQAAEGQHLGQAAFLDQMAFAVEHLDDLVRLDRARADAPGDDAAEIGIGLQDGAEHAERAVLGPAAAPRAGSSGRTAAPCPGPSGPRAPPPSSLPWPSRRGSGNRAAPRWRRARRTGRRPRSPPPTGRASGRSTLLMTTIGLRPTLSAFDTTNLVCGSGPSAASTSTSAPSTMLRMRSTSPPKSAWPGVSTMLMRVSSQWIEVTLARMVMPRSRSRSLESMARSATR